MIAKLAYFFAGFVVAVAASNYAAEYSVEAGQCRLSTVGDGTFQQTDLHTDNYLHPSCGGLSIADKWKGSDSFGWRLGLKGIGAIRARDNEAVDDENAHNHSGNPCAPPGEEGCTLRFNGEGRAFGISAGLTWEKHLANRLSLIGEGGLFFFQHHFKAHAYLVECPTACRQINFNETSKMWDMPSPYAGLTLRYRSVYVAARHYWPTGHRPQSLWNVGDMNEIVVGIVAVTL